MPKKDGFDLAKDILLVCPKKKIIFATAYTLDALDGLMKKVQFGMEVLQKPYDLDAFTALVEDFGPRSLPSKNTDGIQ
jgi:DNA-binding LytR/AlgR family response regulator